MDWLKAALLAMPPVQAWVSRIFIDIICHKNNSIKASVWNGMSTKGWGAISCMLDGRLS